jgi:ABC-type nitrate/sulfonate/bicarbonate transport system substrate-binding protein
MTRMLDHRITCGFIPLTDSLLLVIAKEKGFAAAQGIDLALVRETSWANIRDRVAVGQFDVAHMLGPMPIAASLGLNPISVPFIAPMALGLGGNAVTVSRALWARMAAAGAPADLGAAATGAALAKVVAGATGKLRFGVVHPHSGHNYELRYWLAASGIRPDREVEIVVLPPGLMPDALRSGAVDGYCVGEPWNSVGVAVGAGNIATVKAAIWRSSPEKVLGTTERWAAAHSEALSALIRALHDAANWCATAGNATEAAAILALPRYLDVDAAIIERGLSGSIETSPGHNETVEAFFVPHDRAATFPWTSHALWFYSQMVRWGHVEHGPENARLAAACYRPDLYRAALTASGVAMPGANAKAEGALRHPTAVGAINGMLTLGPDGFFDGRVFDPALLDDYIAAQAE